MSLGEIGGQADAAHLAIIAEIVDKLITKYALVQKWGC
jgi:hypothetical protein